LPNKLDGRPAAGRGAPSATAPLEDWLRWQEALHPQPIALGLERVASVARKLRLPAQGPVTLTVAGTNGKGSTTTLLSEIYLAAGHRVGTYTSPHLLRYNERIAVNGVAAPDEVLTGAFAAVEQARGATALTYFEFGTLAALWLFREAGVTVQVLEVGLGGRLDAVNLVDADCAVITAIGLDHVDYLGKDRDSIGAEKAGILRASRPAVCSDTDPPASIARQAMATGALLWQIGRDFGFQVAADAWNWHGPQRHYKKLPPPALAGDIQYVNAAGAVAAVERLQERLPVPEAAIRAGLVRLRLPGRFERRGRVVLDVAHNVEAARVLAHNLRTLARGGFRVVMGMLSDKPVEGFAAELAPLARKFYAAGLPPPRGLEGTQLAGRIAGPGREVEAYGDVAQAFAAAQAEAAPGELVVACGSFLTVAAVAEQFHG
jgi:dihydrofolate synthase / folylpolyglutamate synthase